MNKDCNILKRYGIDVMDLNEFVNIDKFKSFYGLNHLEIQNIDKSSWLRVNPNKGKSSIHVKEINNKVYIYMYVHYNWKQSGFHIVNGKNFYMALKNFILKDSVKWEDIEKKVGIIKEQW